MRRWASLIEIFQGSLFDIVIYRCFCKVYSGGVLGLCHVDFLRFRGITEAYLVILRWLVVLLREENTTFSGKSTDFFFVFKQN